MATIESPDLPDDRAGHPRPRRLQGPPHASQQASGRWSGRSSSSTRWGRRGSRPGDGIDVRPHPHINLATVTYLFAGAIDHRDCLGTVAAIEPGAVNLMTAGSGHRPFRALAGRRCARPGRSFTASRPGSPCRRRRRRSTRRSSMSPGRRLAGGRGRRRAAAADHGRALWGATSPVTLPLADHLCRHHARRRRRRCRSMPRRTSAALYVDRGRGERSTASRSSRSTSTCSRPGIVPLLSSRERRAC